MHVKEAAPCIRAHCMTLRKITQEIGSVDVACKEEGVSTVLGT